MRQIDGLAAVVLRIIGPTEQGTISVAHGRADESRAIVGIQGNGAVEQIERFLQRRGGCHDRVCQRAQVEIVAGRVVGGPFGRAADFRMPDGRRDDTGHGERHLVLQREDVLQGVLEPLGPDLGAIIGVD